jgi:predicted Rossmann fold nucleotide-binding protein DprA/Smf involved in DNA uptake
MPLGQITLPVTFGTPSNYHTKFIKFEVTNFEFSYHAILERPTLVKFMAIPHYPNLLLKMPGPNGVLFLRGDLKRVFDCDVQAV